MESCFVPTMGSYVLNMNGVGRCWKQMIWSGQSLLLWMIKAIIIKDDKELCTLYMDSQASMIIGENRSRLLRGRSKRREDPVDDLGHLRSPAMGSLKVPRLIWSVVWMKDCLPESRGERKGCHDGWREGSDNWGWADIVSFVGKRESAWIFNFAARERLE